MRATIAAVLLLLGAAGLSAQGIDALSPQVREFVSVDAPVVALRNVRVVDGTGAPARDGQTIVIANGQIAAVGPNAQVTVPQARGCWTFPATP